MVVVWSMSWGLLVLITMSITIKYYLPKLATRALTAHSGALAYSDENEKNEQISDREYRCGSILLQSKVSTVLLLLGCVGYAGLCGYFAGEHAVSIIGLLKMTVAVCVLGCVFITDMELMIIPNLCSIILLAGRALTILFEFIWLKDEAVAWLVNSVVAMIVSLLLLMVMYKITKGGIGMGDVKLFSSLGFLCGIRAVCFTLMFAFLLCALFSSGLLITKKKTLKDSLPLGPFIWLGYGVTVLLSII